MPLAIEMMLKDDWGHCVLIKRKGKYVGVLMCEDKKMAEDFSAKYDGESSAFKIEAES